MFAEVRNCEVRDCFYNQEKICTARAITVGSEKAKCETWMVSERTHSNKMNSALVGACHVGECEYNQSYFCHAAKDIEVKIIDNMAQCATYEPR